MKRLRERRMAVIGIMVALCCLLAVGGAGQWTEEAWGRIPEEMKTQIVSHDFMGVQAMSVMCHAATLKAWELFMPGSDFSPMETFIAALFAGSECLVVAVAPSGNQYWFPTNIAYTQGLKQFSVGWGDYCGLSGAFDGGLLRAETQAWGLVRIPSEIDLALPFKV